MRNHQNGREVERWRRCTIATNGGGGGELPSTRGSDVYSVNSSVMPGISFGCRRLKTPQLVPVTAVTGSLRTQHPRTTIPSPGPPLDSWFPGANNKKNTHKTHVKPPHHVAQKHAHPRPPPLSAPRAETRRTLLRYAAGLAVKDLVVVPEYLHACQASAVVAQASG